MAETLFHKYILGGGWVMVLLVPASIVCLATFFHAASRLWGRNPGKLAEDVRATVLDQRRRIALTLTDARVIAADTAATVYSGLQPLSVIYSIAPLLGATGTAWAFIQIWQGQPASLQGRNIGPTLENAFIPLGWGLVVGLIAITCYAILRARLVHVEQKIFAPAAIAALDEDVPSVPAGNLAPRRRGL